MDNIGCTRMRTRVGHPALDIALIVVTSIRGSRERSFGEEGGVSAEGEGLDWGNGGHGPLLMENEKEGWKGGDLRIQNVFI